MNLAHYLCAVTHTAYTVSKIQILPTRLCNSFCVFRLAPIRKIKRWDYRLAVLDIFTVAR